MSSENNKRNFVASIKYLEDKKDGTKIWFETVFIDNKEDEFTIAGVDKQKIIEINGKFYLAQLYFHFKEIEK